MEPQPLTGPERAFLEAARRAVLATIADDGRPRLVPVCFALVDVDGAPHVVTPLDEKPKQIADVRLLARVRDILARPAVSLLVDRWDEDWSALAWLRVDGEARLVEPAPRPSLHAAAIEVLRRRYPQYAEQDLESRPVIAVRIGRVRGWGRTDGGG